MAQDTPHEHTPTLTAEEAQRVRPISSWRKKWRALMLRLFGVRRFMLPPPVREMLEYSGVDHRVVKRVLRTMGRPQPREFRDAWCRSWTACAEAAEQAGDTERAWQAYYLAQRVWLERSDERRFRYRRALQAYDSLVGANLPTRLVATAKNGDNIVGLLELPPGNDVVPLVVVVPGATGMKEDFARLVPMLHERGFGVLRMDIIGFGETDGKLTPDRLSDPALLTRVAIEHPRVDEARTHGLAFCMGGSLALLAAGEGVLSSLVTVSSMHDLRPIARAMRSEAAKLFAAAFGYDSFDELANAPAAAMPEQLRQCEQRAPVLSIAGAMDQVVPLALVRTYEQFLTDLDWTVDSHVYIRQQHNCSGMLEDIAKRAADWFSEYSSDAPSLDRRSAA